MCSVAEIVREVTARGGVVMRGKFDKESGQVALWIVCRFQNLVHYVENELGCAELYINQRLSISSKEGRTEVEPIMKGG
jgi:hypothetical protein